MTNRIDRQFREQRTRITSQAQERRESLASQARKHREETQQAAEEARKSLREQRSELERGVQAAKSGVRKEEAKEQRKRDLPITKPIEVFAEERIADIERQEEEIKGGITKSEKKVAEAEAKGLEAIAKVEVEAEAEIAKAESEALAAADKAQVEFEAENIQLDTGEYIDRAEFTQLSSEIQDKIKTLGVEGFNSWLGTQQAAIDKYKSDDGYDIAGYLRDNPDADTGDLITIGFTQPDIDSAVAHNTDLAKFETNLQESNPALYEVYKEGGIEAYNTTVEELQAVAEKYAVTAPTPEEYGKQELARWVKKPLPPISVKFDLQSALGDEVPHTTLMQLGFTPVQINTAIQAQELMTRLDTDVYKVDGGYNIPRFLRDNPSFNASDLVTVVGFSQKSVDSAVEYNQQPFVHETPGEKFYNALEAAGFDLWALESLRATSSTFSPALLKAEDEYLQQRLAFNARNPELAQTIMELEEARLIPLTKLEEPTLSLEAFTEAFIAVREPKTAEEKAKLERLAGEEYARLYGHGTTLLSAGSQISSYLFSPSRVLYPEVELKDITPLEWTVGAAQLALLAIPVLSITGGITARGIITGIEIGAGSIFLTATAIQWNDMTPAQRGISLAITAAIFAPVGIRGVRAILTKRGPVVAQAQTSLNRAWVRLDKAKIKYGPENPQYIRALRNVESAQANLKTAIGNMAQSAGRSVKTAINLAQDAGMAARNMERALRQLRRTSVKSRNYIRIAAKAQRAIEASRMADQRFIAQFNRVKSLSARDLAAIEKRAEIPGLKRAVTDVNKAQTNLSKVWAETNRLRAKYGANSPQHLRALQGVYKAKTGRWIRTGSIVEAQAKLDAALANFGLKLKPRVTPSPAAGWESIISKLEGEIVKLRAEVNSLSKATRRAVFESEIKSMNRQLGELRRSLSAKEIQLTEFIKARDAGIPAPVVERYLVRWETKPPTRDELKRIFDQFTRKPVEPTKPQPGAASPKVKVKVATMERPVVVEHQLKLIPEIKKVTPKPEPKVEAPRVKGKGYEISVEYEPSYRERMFERPDIREETYVEAIGEPLPDTLVVVAGQTVDIPATEKAIRTNIATIVKAGIKAASKALIAGKTQPQINAAVLAQIKTQVKAITEPQVKVQIKPLVEVMTKTVVRTIPKLQTKLRIRIRPRPGWPKIPIIVTLPDGSSHQLTPEEFAGSVGWKQGFIYKLIWKPYGENNITNTRKPIPGIPYHSGPGSASRSIVRLGGKVPPEIARDMGIFDIHIHTDRYGKPRIAFKRDIGQKTRLTGRRKKTKYKANKPEPILGVGR